MRTIKRTWIVNVLASGILFLNGCLGGQPAPDHYYRLTVPEPEIHLDPSPLQGTLQVTRPRADALTGARHLVYRRAGNISQLNHHAYHRWIDSPTLLLQQELTHYLRKAGLAHQVFTPAMRARADYALSCRIAKLERVLDKTPRVVMELELGITSIQDRKTLLIRTYREEIQTTETEQEVTTSIHAYNQALSNILHRFLSDIAKLSFVKLTNS